MNTFVDKSTMHVAAIRRIKDVIKRSFSGLELSTTDILYAERGGQHYKDIRSSSQSTSSIVCWCVCVSAHVCMYVKACMHSYVFVSIRM